MADEKKERKDGKKGDQDSGSRPKLSKLVRGAREQVEDLTGRPVSSVLGVERDGDDGWEVTLEVVELERVPETTNIMGCYRVTLDGEGDVVEYRRVRRYHRGQPDEDG
ncbi:MAG TPA: gas vesicle protein [Solirubrobacteraceae bacterium]